MSASTSKFTLLPCLARAVFAKILVLFVVYTCIIYSPSHPSILPHIISTMSDVAYIKSLLGVHPDFPKKVSRLYFSFLSRYLLTQPLSTGHHLP